MFKRFFKRKSKHESKKLESKKQPYQEISLSQISFNKNFDSPVKILIVDDADINRYVLKRYIEIYKKNHNVLIDIHEAANGLECLEKVKNTDYNIIFMDLIMPFMGGIEATKKIFERKSNQILIIGLTGQIEQDTQEKIKESGMQYCIHKPVEMDTIHSILEIFLLDMNQ